MYRGGKKDTFPRAIFSKSGSLTLMSRRHSVCMPFYKDTHTQTAGHAARVEGPRKQQHK